jgi:NAD(P)H-quinone oxidoreductase subunit 5
VSRAADVCFWSALALVWLGVGSLDLDRLEALIAQRRGLTPSLEFAAVLTVLAVALKSAQLPFHGWLTQVMEAPTPVSALLHAGVVNIGGFLVIRLAPWFTEAEFARLLLIVVGLVTTVVGALVMTTRISVKVALAWSTIAQMGFMLVQCGLGAWHLALLHLVAHSLYKAHAFLGWGTVVESWRREQLLAPSLPPSVARFAVATLAVVGGAALAIGAGSRVFASSEGAPLSVWVLGLSVALGLVPMFARPAAPGALLGRGSSAIFIGGLYVAWHQGAARLLPHHTAPGLVTELGWWLVGGAFTLLFALRTLLELWPAAGSSRTLYQWLFAGLYLDERFTRLTFRLWPPRLQRSLTPPTVSFEPVAEAAS